MVNDDGYVQLVTASISGIPSRPPSIPPPSQSSNFRDDLDTALARLRSRSPHVPGTEYGGSTFSEASGEYKSEERRRGEPQGSGFFQRNLYFLSLYVIFPFRYILDCRMNFYMSVLFLFFG